MAVLTKARTAPITADTAPITALSDIGSITTECGLMVLQRCTMDSELTRSYTTTVHKASGRMKYTLGAMYRGIIGATGILDIIMPGLAEMREDGIRSRSTEAALAGAT